jgi:hypothetical protein
MCLVPWLRHVPQLLLYSCMETTTRGKVRCNWPMNMRMRGDYTCKPSVCGACALLNI